MIENKKGVHSRVREQVDRTKTAADQYAEHHKLDFSMCDSDKVEDRGSGKVTVIDG